MGCTTTKEYETNEEKERKENSNMVNEEKVGKVVEDILFTGEFQPINYKSYDVKLPLTFNKTRVRLSNKIKLRKGGKDGKIVITFSPSFDGDIPTSEYNKLEPINRNDLGIIMVQLLRAGILFIKLFSERNNMTRQGKKFIIFMHRSSPVDYKYILYCTDTYPEPSTESRRRTIELYGLRCHASATTIKKEVFEIAAYDDTKIDSDKWFDL